MQRRVDGAVGIARAFSDLATSADAHPELSMYSRPRTFLPAIVVPGTEHGQYATVMSPTTHQSRDVDQRR